MEEMYLNSACGFKCSAGQGVKFVSVPEMLSVVYEGQENLNSRTKLIRTVPGICSYLAETSEPTCKFAIITNTWQGVSKSVVVNGNNALSDKSYMWCNIGGKISPEKSTEIGTNAAIDGSVKMKNENNESEDKSDIKEKMNSEKKEHQPMVMICSNDKDDVFMADDLDKEKSHTDRLCCPYGSKKEKCKNCEYRITESERFAGAIKGASRILRNNYKNEYDKDKTFVSGKFSTFEDELANYKKYGVDLAAHHILSVKNLLENDKMEESEKIISWVKLANYLHYDINEAYNCIMLPTSNKDAKLIGRSDSEVLIYKFEKMELTKQQWHGGQHIYDMTQHNYKHYIFNIPNYAEAMRKLLNKTMSGMSKNICIKDNYEDQKALFEKKMHKIINSVRECLWNFENNPKDSKIYYVSLAAAQYAYGIKQNNEIIYIFNKEDEIYLQKIIVTKKVDSINLEYDIKQEIKLSSFNSKMIALGKHYLSKVEVFILDWNINKDLLPLWLSESIKKYYGLNNYGLHKSIEDKLKLVEKDIQSMLIK